MLFKGRPRVGHAHAAWYVDHPPLVVQQDLPCQLMLCPLLFSGWFIGKAVNVQQHRQALSPITPHSEQRVRILCVNPAHDGDGELSGPVDCGRLNGVVDRRGLTWPEVGQPTDHKFLGRRAVLAHSPADVQRPIGLIDLDAETVVQEVNADRCGGGDGPLQRVLHAPTCVGT
jgi:hypothetical protein